MKKMLFLFFVLAAVSLQAQELTFSVKINTLKLQTVDPKVFITLEQSVAEFLNNQKWTDEIFETNERINCNLVLTIQEELSPTSFKADVAIQTSRPVFGSSYETRMLNHLDKEVTFSYEQFQPLIYSKNVFNDNLSSILAFYIYIILGMDADSFSLFGGDEHYQTAQEILNTVPQNVASSAAGWRSTEGSRNRFWIIENILSPRVRPLRQGLYEYHRQGLDMMSNDVNTGRAIVLQALEEVDKVNQSYPNAMIVQMFSNAKSDEIVEIFKRGTRPEQDRVVQIMVKVDATNAAKYRNIKS
ncbi:MAG: DUF4835 family protein [Saprospiraceae bacterium]|nr:DUF4835 family protein [Saprospiraceae bacterium]MDZ4705736.1 DUF4835 family protein [Saprospiraceae bacterium]